MDLTLFERAVSPAAVADSLRSSVPEFRSGTSQLLGCRVTRLRSTEADLESGTPGGWTATYLLEIRGDLGATTIATHGTLVSEGASEPVADPSLALSEDGWSCWLPDLRLHLCTWSTDAALPGMQAIIHDDSARALLEPLLRRPGTATEDLQITACTATVATYKPGMRATVCCDLEYSVPQVPADWPRSVIVKVHRPAAGRAITTHSSTVVLPPPLQPVRAHRRAAGLRRAAGHLRAVLPGARPDPEGPARPVLLKCPPLASAPRRAASHRRRHRSAAHVRHRRGHRGAVGRRARCHRGQARQAHGGGSVACGPHRGLVGSAEGGRRPLRSGPSGRCAREPAA